MSCVNSYSCELGVWVCPEANAVVSIVSHTQKNLGLWVDNGLNEQGNQISDAPWHLLRPSQILWGEHYIRRGVKEGRERRGHPRKSRTVMVLPPFPKQSQVFTKGDGKWELTSGNNTKSLRSWFFLCPFIHLVHVAQEIRTLWTERPSFVNPTAAIFPTALPALNAFKHLSVSYKSLNGRRKQQQQPPGQLSAA